MVINSYSLCRSGHHAILFWLAKNVVPYASLEIETAPDIYTKIGDGQTTIKVIENRRFRPSDEPTIIILRDPYNNYASFKTLVQKPDFGTVSFFPLLEYWMDYAMEVSGETNMLPNKFFISYNEWATSEDYRRKIVQNFGLKFSLAVSFDDSLKDSVTKYGAGSSFDGFDYAGRASEMKVNERYKKYAGNTGFRSAVDTPEIRKLSQQIFRFNPFEVVEKSSVRDTHDILEDLF